jgi:hypothetical protein
VTDWDAWNPTELNFHMMRLTCQLEGRNPFALATKVQAEGFIKHVGSQEFFEAIKRDGAQVDIEGYLERWREGARIYQQLVQRYWLYQ